MNNVTAIHRWTAMLLSQSYQSLSTHTFSLGAGAGAGLGILPCLPPELIAFRVNNDLQWSPGALWNDIVAEQNLVHSHGPRLQSCKSFC